MAAMKLRLLVAASLLSVTVLGLGRARALAAPAEPTLEDVAWLAGHWLREEGGVRSEEAWFAPGGGLMLGMNREVRAPGKASFEYLRLEGRKDGLVYVASPGGKGATEFTLADLGEGFVEFENPQNDFPQHIRYEARGGELHASIWTGEGEARQAMEWTWKRAPAK